MSSSNRDTSGDRLGSFWTRARDWVLLDGPRSLVAAAAALAIFAFVAAISASPVNRLENVDPLLTVFGSLISGNLTLITVVVSINQLLLSREIQTPHELREQMDGVIDYRDSIENAAGALAPVQPLGFLRLLVQNTRQEAQQLGGLAFSETDEKTYEEIDDVVTGLTRQADRIDELLDESDVSTFEVLSATLTTNYAGEINRLRRLRSPSTEQLPGHVRESVEDLVGHLQNIDIARQYFKGIYLRQELAALSRLLFYVGIPSITAVATAFFLFTTDAGTSLPHRYLTALSPTIITIGLFPLCLLFAFIVRTATVTRRTAATIPFTAPEQEK